MSRLIDADTLKEFIDDCGICAICPQKAPRCSYDCDFPEFVTEKWNVAIDAQPTIEAPSWIPCLERLPNNDEEVIVSVEDDRADNIFKYTTTAWRYGDVWVSDNERICGIIAWMPLPQSYEETDHE